MLRREKERRERMATRREAAKKKGGSPGGAGKETRGEASHKHGDGEASAGGEAVEKWCENVVRCDDKCYTNATKWNKKCLWVPSEDQPLACCACDPCAQWDDDAMGQGYIAEGTRQRQGEGKGRVEGTMPSFTALMAGGWVVGWRLSMRRLGTAALIGHRQRSVMYPSSFLP